MPNKEQDLEKVTAAENAQSEPKPPKTKKPTTRKRTAAPKAKEEVSAKAAEPEKEEIKPEEKKAEEAPAKPAPRKRSTGTKKAAPKKASETEKEKEEKEPEPQRAEPDKAEEPQKELPLLEAPNDKLPVQVQPERGVQRAVPPIDLSALGKERRNFWGRVFLLLSVGIVLALSIVILVYRPTVYSARTHSIRFLYNGAENTTQVLYDGKLCKTVLQGECTQSMYDETGSICAATVGGKLYLVQGDEIEEISATVQDFQLSQNGGVLVYRDAENQLRYIGLLGKNEKYTVSRHCEDGRYALSPDGNVLFYTYVEQNAQEAPKTHAAVFLVSGEKPFFARTTDIVPVAISDDCEHIFYFNGAGDLYYMNKKGEISLCRSAGEGGMQIFFDREFEEMLVKDAKGVMLWQDGKETLIPQLKGTESLTLLQNHRAETRDLPLGTQCLIRSFDKNYYLKKGGEAEGARLAYLSGDTLSEVAFLSETESAPIVTDKGVYYLERVEGQDGVRKHLYFCPIGKTVATQLSWDVEDYCVNSDGSYILHKDHQGRLYADRVANSRLDSVLISDYVDGELRNSNATDIFYYYVDGKLYASDNGKKPEEALDGEFAGFEIDVHTVFLFEREQDGSYTVYTRQRNRNKLVQVASGIIDID